MEYGRIADLIICANGKGANIKPVYQGYVLNIPPQSGNAGLLEISFTERGIGRLSVISIENFSSIPILIDNPVPISKVRVLVDHYYEEWYSLMEARRKNNPTPDKVFLGNEFCAKCHPSEYQAWQQTAHSKAYEKLKQVEKRCIPCHTTGFGYPTGFWDIETTEKLAGVGCEECHLVPKRPFIRGLHKTIAVDSSTCRCHIPPHDNDFEFSRAVKKIMH